MICDVCSKDIPFNEENKCNECEDKYYLDEVFVCE